MSTCPQMDGIAMETSITAETMGTAEQPEMQVLDEDETDADNENQQKTESGMDEEESETESGQQEDARAEVSETMPQADATELETPVAETDETEITESVPQEETQTENTDSALREETQTHEEESVSQEGTQAGETEPASWEEIQTAETESVPQEETQTETVETTVETESQTEITETAETEPEEETLAEDVYDVQSDNGEQPFDDNGNSKSGFELQNGSIDITSGRFGAILAHITLQDGLDGTDGKDYVKTLNPRIVGADGVTDAYFKNLMVTAENNGANSASQYRLTGDVKAETPIGTYTITMTLGKTSDTATFAVVEKGIESLTIKGIPSVVLSEKKVNIKPALEINGDTAGNDKTTTPKNKKMIWETVGVEGTAVPASLKINRQNGAVTVNAGDSGAFRIKATTADNRYTDTAGNPVSVTSGIVEVVSTDDQRLESLAGCTIVLTDASDPAKAHLLNQDGKTADMGSLDGKTAYIKIQKADGSFVDASNYVLKANNKAFRIGADTGVSCVLTKPIASGKTLTVKLTASLVNGRKEQPLKGEIVIRSAALGEHDLSLALSTSGAGRSELKDDGRTLEYNGSASTLIRMELMKDGSPAGSPASYNLRLKNLKKVSQTVSKDSIVIYAILNKASGSVTLTDCATGRQTTYEVRNTEKTTVAGKSPTIRQRTTPAPDAGPDYGITVKGKSVTDYTHVRVELLPAEYMKSCRSSKGEMKYRAFAGALGLDPYGNETAFKVYEVAPEDNTFRIPFVKAEQPAKGSYKLQMTVGKMTGNRFEATAVPVIVTTKVSGNRAVPERTPQEEQRLSRIEGISAVADKAEYDRIFPSGVWTGKPESFADISPSYTLVSSSNRITVSGSLKKVEGFIGYSSEEKDQSGYYMLARVKLPTQETENAYSAMTGTLRSVSERTFTGADLTVEGSDIYLNILIKIAEPDAVTAANITLALDFDGEGQTYRENTYTFDLSGVELEKDTKDVKVLVAYFSATNTTEGVAKRLANGMEADIYEIVPEVPYTSADLNYGDSNSRTSIEMNDPTCRPAISGSVENMDQYDVVFIGYPIWWGQAPKIMYTFMESYDFSGKTIVPFCTSGSSPIGSSATNLAQITSGAAWLPGRRFSGSASQSTLMDWVNSLNLTIKK